MFITKGLAGIIHNMIKLLSLVHPYPHWKRRMGGIKPIVIGNTLCWLVVKAAEKYPNGSSQNQLGFVVAQGSESAIHAARAWVSSHWSQGSSKTWVKKCFQLGQRGSNSRSSPTFPKHSSLISVGCSKDSKLLFGKHKVSSAEGIQQGNRETQMRTGNDTAMRNFQFWVIPRFGLIKIKVNRIPETKFLVTMCHQNYDKSYAWGKIFHPEVTPKVDQIKKGQSRSSGAK